MNRDPIGYDGGMDLYAYCDNNPVMGVDPSGFQAKDNTPGANDDMDGVDDSRRPTVYRHAVKDFTHQAMFKPGSQQRQDYATAMAAAVPAIALAQSGGVAATGYDGLRGTHTSGLRRAFDSALTAASLFLHFGGSWNNGWRGADGKFTSPSGAIKAGEAAVDDAEAAINAKKGWTVVGREISCRVKGVGSIRRYDIVAQAPSGRYVGFEVKSGSATQTAAQCLFDSTVSRSRNALGLGNAKNLVISRSVLIRRP